MECMLIVIPLPNNVNLQLKEGALFVVFHRARAGALFATFGSVWSCVLMMPLEAALKYGTMQV